MTSAPTLLGKFEPNFIGSIQGLGGGGGGGKPNFIGSIQGLGGRRGGGTEKLQLKLKAKQRTLNVPHGPDTVEIFNIIKWYENGDKVPDISNIIFLISQGKHVVTPH